MPQGCRSWLALGFVGLGLVDVAVAQPSPTAPALVPAQFGPKPDGLGGQWIADGGLYVRHMSSYSPIHMIGNLTVNQSGHGTTSQMMTPDGSEYVLTFSTNNNVSFTRRIKFDSKSNTVRFVDSFSSASATPVSLSVVAMVNLRQSNPRMLASSGGAFAALGAKDVGFALPAVRANGPGFVYYVADARAKLKPSVRYDNNNSAVMITYGLTVAAGKPVSIVHGAALRPITGAEDAKALAKLFQPFLAKDWTKDLPAELRKQFVNRGGGGASDELSADSLLADVQQMAEASQVELGAKSVLVMDENSQLSGSIRGQQVTVATSYGKVTVPLAEVAAISGGGGEGRTPRVLLRNGEIHAGVVSESLVLEDEGGLEVKLDSARLRELFLPAAKPAPRTETVVLLETRDGSRIAIDPQMKFTAAAAWGKLELTAARIRQLYPVRDPQPIHRVVFQDGSRLTVILQGTEFSATSPRFGALKLSTSEITKLVTVTPPVAAKEDDAESEEPKASRWQLVGENVLVGQLAESQLRLITPTGETNIDVAQIQGIEARDSAEGSWVVSLSGGNDLVGQLAEPVWRIRSLDKVWTIPVRHLASYESGKDKKESRPKPSAARPQPTAPASADPFGDDPFK